MYLMSIVRLKNCTKVYTVVKSHMCQFKYGREAKGSISKTFITLITLLIHDETTQTVIYIYLAEHPILL